MNIKSIAVVLALVVVTAGAVMIISADDSEALPSVETDYSYTLNQFSSGAYSPPYQDMFTTYSILISSGIEYHSHTLEIGGIEASPDVATQYVPSDRTLYGMVIDERVELRISTSQGSIYVVIEVNNSFYLRSHILLPEYTIFKGVNVQAGDGRMTFEDVPDWLTSFVPMEIGDYTLNVISNMSEGGYTGIVQIHVVPAPEWSPLWTGSSDPGDDNSGDATDPSSEKTLIDKLTDNSLFAFLTIFAIIFAIITAVVPNKASAILCALFGIVSFAAFLWG